MATSTYQNHFLQRGRFNAGSAPTIKKKTAPATTALGLTALRMAPVLAPYAKKLYDSYSINRASNYLEDVLPTKYINPLTGEVVNYDTGYKLSPLSKAGQTLSKTPSERLQEGVFGKQEAPFQEYQMLEDGTIAPVTPETDKLLANNPYDASAYYNETGLLPEVKTPDTYAGLNSQGPAELADYAYTAPAEYPQLTYNTADALDGVIAENALGYDGSQYTSMGAGLGDWNGISADYVDPSTYYAGLPDVSANWSPSYDFSPSDYYSGMPSSESLVSDWGGNWGADSAASSAASDGFGATFDAASGEWVGSATGTDGFGGGFGDLGGGWTAGGMSAASDLLAGRDINVGKAAGSAGGAMAGFAAGNAVFPGVGGVVGGALGSMFGGAVGGGGKVICTELHRQGYLSDRIMELDDKFGKQQELDVVVGYHYWAKPLANLMRKSKIVTWIVKPFVRSWAQTMAAAMSPEEFKPTVLGTIMMKIGKFICKKIGKRINSKNLVDSTNEVK